MLPCTLAWHEPPQPCSGERGIENEAGLNGQGPVGAVAIQGEQEGQAADEMRRGDLHEHPALVMGLAYETDVAEP